jgi:hypothetical protein
MREHKLALGDRGRVVMAIVHDPGPKSEWTVVPWVPFYPRFNSETYHRIIRHAASEIEPAMQPR